MIEFSANGKEYKRKETITVQNFLKELNISPKSVIIEYNKNVLSRQELSTTFLKNGDTLEVIRAFAGG